ncbi:MAG: class I SAM-dependent methyltransferase [bacterium]|nr:class I SAM-dependent methyltransferase [bacterium]
MQKIKNIIKSVISITYFPWLVTVALRKLVKSTNSINFTPEEAYNWTEQFRVGPIVRGFNINFRSSQIKEEIISLMTEVRERAPRIVLEIGTATGGTLFMLAKAAAPDAKIISIDLPFGRYGAGYLKYRIPLMQAFASSNQTLELLRLDSHSQETINELKEIIGDEKIDFLFIDGDHSYEGVKSDFENYYPLVKPGGLIAFHDIVTNDLDPSFGTQRFWQEIKGRFEHKEYIKENRGNSGCGIGLIKKPAITIKQI